MLNSIDQTPDLVSIIMPTYNHGPLIGTAIESVINQTHQNFELIIINNHSSDNTNDIIAQFNDSRIHHILFSNNGSIAASRNVGIRHAKGQWVAFLDSDDYWYPNKLQLCLAELKKQDGSFCVHGEMLFNEDGRTGQMMPPSPEKISFKSILTRGNTISTSSVVIKNSLLDQAGFFEEDRRFITAEDYDLWLRVLLADAKVVSVRQELGGHRQHNQNWSSKVTLHHDAVLEVLKKHFDGHPELRTQFSHRIAHLNYCTGRNAYKQKDFPKSRHHLIAALQGNPFSVKTLVALLLTTIKSI